MNPSERLASRYLLSIGYDEVLKVNLVNEPDFICDRKDRYEIKKINTQGLVNFSAGQILNYRDGDKVMLYDNVKLVSIIEFTQIKKLPFKADFAEHKKVPFIGIGKAQVQK